MINLYRNPHGIHKYEIVRIRKAQTMFDKITRKNTSFPFIYRVLSILCIFSFAASLFFPFSLYASAAPDDIDEEEARRQIPIESNSIENWPDGPVINAQSAILIEAGTGTVLYEKNANEALYPASTTKILSCLLAIENCELNEIVSFSHEAVFSVPKDGSKIAIDVGEELTMEECLNAILIRSANEVTNAVAEHVAGSIPAFVEMMNERAKQLGCTNTNFVNANGLHDDNHYTTAHDLAMMGRAFFANELLCRMSVTKVLHLYPTDKQPDEIWENNHNQLLPGSKYAYEYLVGSKTGYTDQALSTLVTCAEKDGMRLICVVLKDKAPSQYEDTITLFNYGFSNFEPVNISQTETKYNIDNTALYYSTNDIFGNTSPILSLDTSDYIILPKTASFSDVTSSINYNTVKENCIAEIEYSYHGAYIGSARIHLAESNKASYDFEEVMADTQDTEGVPKKKNVIFINIVKVFLWIIGIAGGLIVILFLRAFFLNYQFDSRDSRRRWKRRRRKRRQTIYQTRTQIRRKKAKRPNRFRDYDF